MGRLCHQADVIPVFLELTTHLDPPSQAGSSKVAAPINIYSGSNSSLGAALTNPTELSKLKGNVQNIYPVSFKDNPFRPKDTSGAEKYFQDKPAGERFVSAEDAYQHFKKQ